MCHLGVQCVINPKFCENLRVRSANSFKGRHLQVPTCGGLDVISGATKRNETKRSETTFCVENETKNENENENEDGLGLLTQSNFLGYTTRP